LLRGAVHHGSEHPFAQLGAAPISVAGAPRLKILTRFIGARIAGILRAAVARVETKGELQRREADAFAETGHACATPPYGGGAEGTKPAALRECLAGAFT